MRFFPLAMSSMRDHGTCVAGVDLNSGQWIRPVLPGRSCLFEEQSALFKANCVHDVDVGARPELSVGASAYHSEDRVFIGIGDVGGPISSPDKQSLLSGFTDGSLASSLFVGDRSLFLIGPENQPHFSDEYKDKPRFTPTSFTLGR